MTPAAETIANLLAKKIARQPLTEAEQIVLLNWVQSSSANQRLYDELLNDKTVGMNLVKLLCIDRESRAKQLFMAIRAIRLRMYWLLSAAALVLCVVGIWIYHSANVANKSIVDATQALPDLLNNKTVKLVTENGVTYDLERATGVLGDCNARVDFPGKVSLLPGNIQSYCRITSSTTRQCIVSLADGSIVHLYKKSSIRFPSTFIPGPARNVELLGLAYFEVRASSAAPFTITTVTPGADPVTVVALGTKLLVDATGKHSVSATLIDGRADMRTGSSQAVLRAGYTGRLDLSSNVLMRYPVDTISALQWMDEFASFDKMPVKLFLDTIARYYQVHFNYKGNWSATPVVFTRIARNDCIDSLLLGLQRAGVINFIKLNNKTFNIRPTL